MYAVCGYVHMNGRAFGVQKRASGPLDLELLREPEVVQGTNWALLANKETPLIDIFAAYNYCIIFLFKLFHLILTVPCEKQYSFLGSVIPIFMF